MVSRGFTTGAVVVVALGLWGCPDDGDDGGDLDGGGGQAGGGGGGGGGACAGFDCAGHGQCEVAGGLPSCRCDPGFVASGLDCVSEDPTDPEPPAGFTCPAPGAGGEPMYTLITGSRWYFNMNDRACSMAGWHHLFAFGADGVVTIKGQLDPRSSPRRSGTFIYGCWSYEVPEDGRILLRYVYEDDTTHNCTSLAGLDDPPCEALLERVDGDTLLIVRALESYQERRLVRRVTDDACVWCSDPGCCAEPGWVDADGAALCP